MVKIKTEKTTEEKFLRRQKSFLFQKVCRAPACRILRMRQELIKHYCIITSGVKKNYLK